MPTYPPETVIAEKLEAAVQLELDNSRMKDFYDLDWLSRHREFDFVTLRSAVANTFERRGTTMPGEAPFALTNEFASDATKQMQWHAFLRKNKLNSKPFEQVIARLNQFLLPVLREDVSARAWHPEFGWSETASDE